MRIVDSTTLNGLNFDNNFGVRLIDIDFYNSTKRSLFLGHVGDHNLTVLHLIIPDKYKTSTSVSAIFRTDGAEDDDFEIAATGGSGEYYIPITAKFSGNQQEQIVEKFTKAHRGVVQFKIITTKLESGEPVAELRALSPRIPYVLEESLSLETEPINVEELSGQEIVNLLALINGKPSVSDVQQIVEDYVTEHESDLSGFEKIENRVSTLNNSNDNTYPTTGAVYRAIDSLKNSDLSFIKQDISTLQSDKANKIEVYTKNEINTSLANKADISDIPDISNKADKATTLAGYGIIDGENVDNKVDSVTDNTPDNKYPSARALRNAINTLYRTIQNEFVGNGDCVAITEADDLDECIDSGYIYRYIENGKEEYKIFAVGTQTEYGNRTIMQFLFSNDGKFYIREGYSSGTESGVPITWNPLKLLSRSGECSEQFGIDENDMIIGLVESNSPSDIRNKVDTLFIPYRKNIDSQNNKQLINVSSLKIYYPNLKTIYVDNYNGENWIEINNPQDSGVGVNATERSVHPFILKSLGKLNNLKVSYFDDEHNIDDNFYPTTRAVQRYVGSKEDTANKVSYFNDNSADTNNYPTTLAVKDYVDANIVEASTGNTPITADVNNQQAELYLSIKLLKKEKLCYIEGSITIPSLSEGSYNDNKIQFKDLSGFLNIIDNINYKIHTTSAIAYGNNYNYCIHPVGTNNSSLLNYIDILKLDRTSFSNAALEDTAYFSLVTSFEYRQ